MASTINIRKLTLEELAGVISLYPWYGAARKEMCLRMARLGKDAWSPEQYSDAALYLGSRRIISDLIRSGASVDCSDKDLEALLASYLAEKQTPARQKVRAAGGDFFTQDQYDAVKQEDDNVFSKFAARAREEKSSDTFELSDLFCTETLAEIYAEQGYYDQAKHIYSKLSLNFPEKSAYFAVLIEKLEQKTEIK